MTGGYDERCAADLANVCEGRDLSREDRAWLARVVTGAVRPNRDKPLWDLAHALCALARLTSARDGRDLVSLALDPGLARPNAIAARFGEARADGVCADERGLVFADGAGWRTTWAGLARLLALAEFLLTAEDLGQFALLSGWFGELAETPDGDAAPLLGKRLGRHLAAYRNAHLPLAPLERRFRGLLGYLRGRAEFDDDDILAFWCSEMEQGERPGFRTIAEHFVTFEAAAGLRNGLDNLTAADSLEAHVGWEERLDASLADLVAGDPAETLVDLLAGLAEGPKILTGAERDDLADLLRLEPFHRTRPLTALRATSFGRVQAGLSNRLRRGGGGLDLAERVACTAAETYSVLAERVAALAAHLDRMLRIAAALRVPAEAEGLAPETRDALAAARADIRRVRRAGFDDPARLAEGFAAADSALVRLAGEIDRFQRAIARLVRHRPLEPAFTADRDIFAKTFAQAYVAEATA